jgi:cadmium resistance protein CadD (predicted permease)
VGLVHKAIVFLVGHGLVESIILYGATSIGFWILLLFLQRDLQRIKMKYFKKESMFSFSFYFFLCIMPFSYQRWEKYLILILPFVAIGWMLMAREVDAEKTSDKILQTKIV